MTQATSQAPTKRIVAIDTLRGFALLGILLMNIMSFAMPSIAYFNPTAFGGDEWYNRLTYAIVHTIADQKFMALFSMLFGASVILVLTKLQEKGQKVARFHYTRNFWLLIFGSIHAIFWSGDILVVYAVCSFILFFFRNVAPSWQFALGLILFLSPAPLYAIGYAEVLTLPREDVAYLDEYWSPSQADLDAEIATYLGGFPSGEGFLSDFGTTGSEALDIYFAILMYNFFARAMGMMLMGMAFFSWGIVSAKRSDQFYRRMLLIGFGVGYPIIIIGLILHEQANWSATYSPMLGQIPNLLGTPLVASGYIAMIMLWSRTEFWKNLQNRLASVGQMALSNYILQTIIATTLFYGHGLGWFGSIDRLGLIPIMIAIWIFQLIISPIWMARFRYGWLEWLWRSLSYWKIQPMRRKKLSNAS